MNGLKHGRNDLHSVIYKLINSIWNKEQLYEKWKNSVNVLINKKYNNRFCSK